MEALWQSLSDNPPQLKVVSAKLDESSFRYEEQGLV